MECVWVDENNKVYRIDYNTSDTIEGSIAFDIIPEPSNLIGKYPVLKYDPETNTLFYEYFDRPLTTDEIFQQWNEKSKTATQRYEELDKVNTSLAQLRQAKLEALDESCNLAIVGGFKHTIGTKEYLFSCSHAAQSNFQGTDSLFRDGLVPNGMAEWTAINVATGKVERVQINQTTFNTLKLKVFQHINSNISKFRNTLQPKVEAATTNSEVDAVVW
jgi:hypothetical protein